MATRTFLYASAVAAAAQALAVVSYGPGAQGPVEVGVSEIYVVFDEDVAPCVDSGDSVVCAGGACGNASGGVFSGARATFALAAPLSAFSSEYEVVVAAGAACGVGDPGGRSPEVRWSLRTVEEPVIEDDAKTANSSVVVRDVEVFGLGLFVNDVASIDLAAGTFYGDVDVFVLRYYRAFLDRRTALAEATTEGGPRGRVCAFGTTSEEAKWVFLAADEAPDLQLINGGKFPKVEALYRGGDGDILDHVRVRTEFYFEPTLAEYPFQTQVLPVAAEGCENPNFKGSYLGGFPLVLADFGTSDHLSERSRSMNFDARTRAHGTAK